jgi:preprotein translocase subunit SecG
MFLYPLLLGALPCLFFRQGTGRFWNDGILLLIGGSLLSGVLEIYGTSSSLTDMIFWLGVVFLILDLMVMAFKKRDMIQKRNG